MTTEQKEVILDQVKKIDNHKNWFHFILSGLENFLDCNPTFLFELIFLEALKERERKGSHSTVSEEASFIFKELGFKKVDSPLKD